MEVEELLLVVSKVLVFVLLRDAHAVALGLLWGLEKLGLRVFVSSFINGISPDPGTYLSKRNDCRP
jgi:hypothetical protein